MKEMRLKSNLKGVPKCQKSPSTAPFAAFPSRLHDRGVEEAASSDLVFGKTAFGFFFFGRINGSQKGAKERIFSSQEVLQLPQTFQETRSQGPLDRPVDYSVAFIPRQKGPSGTKRAKQGFASET